jgi:hypothetical protein
LDNDWRFLIPVDTGVVGGDRLRRGGLGDWIHRADGKTLTTACQMYEEERHDRQDYYGRGVFKSRPVPPKIAEVAGNPFGSVPGRSFQNPRGVPGPGRAGQVIPSALESFFPLFPAQSILGENAGRPSGT